MMTEDIPNGTSFKKARRARGIEPCRLSLLARDILPNDD